jgi:glycosyltransferase involved in cell wall biosynthesis
MSRDIAFVVPGRLDQLTGGYLFERQVVEGLRARGRSVRVIELTGRDPATKAAVIAGLPEDSKVVVDGLALNRLGDLIAAQAGRLRLVAFVHGPLAQETDLLPAAAERAALREAQLLSRVRGVLCPSRKTAAAVEGYGVPPERIAVVAPGAARPRSPAAVRHGPVRELLCVANLVPRKGHTLLVEALAGIRRLDWRLTCIGSLTRDPATTRAVRRKISTTGLAGRIVLAGEWPQKRLGHAYREADAFVLPSFHEGYGMVYAEAMVHGLPVIATTAGAIPDTVPRHAGLLVPPGDRPALTRALRRVLRQPALAARMAAGSRAAGARLPGWRQATQLWEAAFDRLADLPPPALSQAGGESMNHIG